MKQETTKEDKITVTYLILILLLFVGGLIRTDLFILFAFILGWFLRGLRKWKYTVILAEKNIQTLKTWW